MIKKLIGLSFEPIFVDCLWGLLCDKSILLLPASSKNRFTTSFGFPFKSPLQGSRKRTEQQIYAWALTALIKIFWWVQRQPNPQKIHPEIAQELAIRIPKEQVAYSKDVFQYSYQKCSHHIKELRRNKSNVHHEVSTWKDLRKSIKDLQKRFMAELYRSKETKTK